MNNYNIFERIKNEITEYNDYYFRYHTDKEIITEHNDILSAFRAGFENGIQKAIASANIIENTIQFDESELLIKTIENLIKNWSKVNE